MSSKNIEQAPLNPYAQRAAQRLREVQEDIVVKPRETKPETTTTETTTTTTTPQPRINPLSISTNTVPSTSSSSDEIKEDHKKVKVTQDSVMLRESGGATTTDETKTQPLPMDMVMCVYKKKSMTVQKFLERAEQRRPIDFTLESSAPMYDKTRVLRRTKSAEQLVSERKEKNKGKVVKKEVCDGWGAPHYMEIQIGAGCSYWKRRFVMDDTGMLRALMLQLFGEPTKDESRARELMDVIVLTHHRITDSETLVREMLDVYHNPRVWELATISDEKKARWERENREWALRCLLLWAKCVREFDTDTRALPMFASFLCDEALAQHPGFVTECCRSLLPLLVPMFSNNTKTSATLSCTKTFHEINAFLSPLSAPLEQILFGKGKALLRRSRSSGMVRHESKVIAAMDWYSSLCSTLKNLDEKESQVTESHLAIFWRSCVFARTTTHGRKHCFHEFVAHEGVTAAAAAFAISSHNVVVLARKLVDSGELRPVTPGTTFDNNSERFFFVDEVPKVQLVFPARDFHSGFFPPFCGTLPENIPLLDVPPLELARQLTLFEHDMLRSWRLAELESGKWSDRSVRLEVAPNISALVDHTDRLAKWVSCTIVMMGADLKQRVKALTYFVELADACRELHNFNAMRAIVFGLRNSSVERLTATHNALSFSVKQRLRALKKPCNYWRLSVTAEPPLVPDVMSFLKIVQCILDTLYLNYIYNMENLRQLTKAYRMVLDAKHKPFPFKRHPQLQALLKNGLDTTHYEELETFSMKYEPPQDDASSASE